MLQLNSLDRRGWLIAITVSTVLVGLVLSPPFLSESIRPWVMELFAGVCHQLPGRSFHIDAVPLAVCQRCFGIYAAFPMAGILFWTVGGAWPFSSRTAPLVLLASGLPALFDWGGEIAGFWSNTPVSRLSTGLVLGLVAGYFFTAALAEGFRRKTVTNASESIHRNPS